MKLTLSLEFIKFGVISGRQPPDGGIENSLEETENRIATANDAQEPSLEDAPVDEVEDRGACLVHLHKGANGVLHDSRKAPVLHGGLKLAVNIGQAVASVFNLGDEGGDAG